MERSLTGLPTLASLAPLARHGALAGLAALLGAMALAPSPARSADLVVKMENRAGLPLSDAVVYAVRTVSIPHGKLPSAIIDQVHRQFEPRVSVVQVGTAVEFPNSDNILHSVYSFSPAKVFRLKLYAGRSAPPVVFDKPGLVVLGCDIHDNMIAWLLVVNTPYFGKSGEKGLVTLRNLRAGDYTLDAWHVPMREAIAAQRLRVVPGTALPPITIRLDAGDTLTEGPASAGMAH